MKLEQVVKKIFLVRGQKVILDADLAEMYAVETRILNQAVKRNIERFHVSIIKRRVGKLEITKCDIKFKLGR